MGEAPGAQVFWDCETGSRERRKEPGKGGKIPRFLEINNLEMLGDAPKKSGGKKRDRRLRWSHPILAYIWFTTWPEGQAASPQVTPALGGQAYIPVAVRTGSCPPPPHSTAPHRATLEPQGIQGTGDISVCSFGFEEGSIWETAAALGVTPPANDHNHKRPWACLLVFFSSPALTLSKRSRLPRAKAKALALPLIPEALARGKNKQ